MADVKILLNEFLELHGAEILPVTNEFEQARFKTVNGTCVIYRNNKGAFSFSNDHAKVAFTAFMEDKPWNASKKHQRIMRKTIEKKLLERDGPDCFYCVRPFTEAFPPTLEHFLSIQQGGNNHINNLALACEPCNLKAGSLPIAEKLKIRIHSMLAKAKAAAA